MVRPETNSGEQLDVEQQTELAPPESADAVPVEKNELPEDLAEVAASATVGQPLVTQLVTGYGIDVVRRAVEAIEQRYDSKGVAVVNRGGMLRVACRDRWVPVAEIVLTGGDEATRKLDSAAVIARVMAIRFQPDNYSAEEKHQALADAVAVGEEPAARRLAEAWGVTL